MRCEVPTFSNSHLSARDRRRLHPAAKVPPSYCWGYRLMMYRQQAQGLVEYGLIIALVAILAIAGLLIFGPAVGSLLSSVSGSV
jgi:hypothetical protein